MLSEAAKQLRRFDLGGASRVDKRLRPKKRRKGLRGWVARHLSVNYRSPYRGAKGLLCCLGVRG